MEEEFVFKDTQDLSFLTNRIQSAHAVYKDLLNPTVTWDTLRAKESTINPDYVPKQTVFLKDPDFQKTFREDILEKIEEKPSPGPLHLQSDILLSEFLDLKLKNTPALVKATLAKYYYEQVHFLQQFKYKFILNWANICQFIPMNINIIKDKLRKMDVELIDCVESYERLKGNDDIPLVPQKKDVVKPEIAILPRDIQYYITKEANSLKDSRGLQNLSYKIKWMWVANRTEIWKKSMALLADLKLRSVERMKLLTGLDDIGEQKLVVSVITNVNLKNLKKQQEIRRRAKADHSTFAEEHKNLNEQLLGSSKDDIDAPPQILTNLKQLNGMLDLICKEFRLVGDVVSDEGHTLSYQITHLLPELFEAQRKRQEWKPYETPEKDITTLRMGYIQSLKRASTLKKHGTEMLGVQVPGYKFIKTLSIKPLDWLKFKKLTPQIPIWQRKQMIRLNEFDKQDSLLKSSFNLLEVQDISTINRVIEEFSMNYCERASKKGVLRTDLGLSDSDIKKRYFSALLADEESSGMPNGEDEVDLSLITIKGLYTLKLLKSRGLRQKLFEVFNYYSSIERKLVLDISHLDKASENVFTQSEKSSNPLLESLDGEITQYLPDKMPEIYGRQDCVEIIEGNIYIIDEAGEYIIYADVEAKVTKILNELLLLGTFYIDKYEVWSEDQGENSPVIDRDLLVNELLELEVKFQEAKVKLITDYLEIYKHSVRPSQQLQVCQKISDLMALRPRLYLQGSYFAQSYWAHIQVLEKHSFFLKSVLAQYNVDNEITTNLYMISEIWDKVNNTVAEISVIQETETPIAYSTLEESTWEQCYDMLRLSSSYHSPFQEKIIIDDYAQVSSLLHTLRVELNDRELMPKLQPSMFESKVRGSIPKEIPDDLQLQCNLFEVFRIRKYLEQHYEETQILEGVYRKQCLAMKRENLELDFINFYPGNPHISNLRDWPGSRSNFRLPAYEITPILTENLDFLSSNCVKSMLISPGIQELKAVTEYQATHKHTLIIATQLNQHICDRIERQIAEIELARTLKYVCKKTKVHWPNVLGRKGEGLVEEKAENEIKSLKARIFSGVCEMFTDCKRFKSAHRESMKNNYLRIMQKYNLVLGEKSEYIGIVSRSLISQLVNGYCREILRDVYTIGIKTNIIKVSQEIKRMVRMVPSKLFQEYFTSQPIFDSENKFGNFIAIPTVEFIMALPGVQTTDVWKNWDPYFFAETPDVVIKKIKHIAFRPRNTETGVTNITITNEWSYSSQLKTLAQVMQGFLHILQILLYSKFLTVKNTHVMDLQDTVLEGRNYWENKENNKEASEMHLKAIEGLIMEESPVDTLHSKIKETFEEIKEINEIVKDLPIESQVAYIVQTAGVYFEQFAVVAYESLEKSLENFKPSDSENILNWITPMFRMNRRSLYVAKSSLYEESTCPMINLCEKIVFIDNAHADVIGTGYIQELEIAFFPNSELIRKYALNEFSELENRLKAYIVSKQAKAGLHSLETMRSYLEIILQAKRLKSAYLLTETALDLISDPETYSKVNSSYQNSLGLKALISAKSIREDKYLAQAMAECKILREHFHVKICKFTIDFIQSECSRVLDTSRLQNNISLENEFTCNADRNYNDITRRIGSLHLYLNSLRNRCTLVEAPTCGKAQVYLIKDMTKLTKKFLDNIVKFMETEYRTREESFFLQYSFYEQLKGQKDSEILELKTVFKNLQGNLDNLVNSQLSQKGNALIYELDRSHRKLQEIKANMKLMPQQVRDIVYLDYKEEIEKNGRMILDIKQNFFNFKSQLTQELKADISLHKTTVFNEIKGKTSKAKAKDIMGLMAEDQSFTRQKQDIDLNSLQAQITKIRTIKIWAKMFKKQKFQKNITDLEEQLSSNQFLWEQLNESQRREALLKQELSYTQQSLASAEKLADRLQTNIEDMNNQRLRLQQYKSNKGKRLNELEIRVKQQEKSEHKDNQILLSQFYVQNEKIQSLQISEAKAGQEYIPHHQRYQKEIQHLKKTLEREQNMKLSAFEELSKFRNQMKSLNKNPDSKIRELKNEYQKLTSELKSIKDQNGIFKKRMVDLGDKEYLESFHSKIDISDVLSSFSIESENLLKIPKN